MLIVFALFIVLASVVSGVLLLLAATAVVPLVMVAGLHRLARAALPKRLTLQGISRAAVVLGILTLLVVSLFMMAAIWVPGISDYNRVLQTFAVLGGTVTIAGWIGTILAPTLSRAEFGEGMAAQTEIIVKQL